MKEKYEAVFGSMHLRIACLCLVCAIEGEVLQRSIEQRSRKTGRDEGFPRSSVSIVVVHTQESEPETHTALETKGEKEKSQSISKRREKFLKL